MMLFPTTVERNINPRLDAETQDDDRRDRWLHKDHNGKETRNRMPPSVEHSAEGSVGVQHVRALVDDEAEDEDDDPLEDEDEEGSSGEEDDGAAGELFTEDATEKPVDMERRSELHSRWLEQQDVELEDSIVHRMESGRRSKRKRDIPALCSEQQEIRAGLEGDSSTQLKMKGTKVKSASADLSSDIDTSTAEIKDAGWMTGSNSLAGIVCNEEATEHQDDETDFRDSSDDEEAKERLRHQLFLEDSEEQTEFLSVVEDDSSREIFGLINKVNVAPSKPRIGHSESRMCATVAHHSHSAQYQSTFARRKVFTSVTTTRQGCGNSRSYVFGRDNNSRDASSSNDKPVDEATKNSSSASGTEPSCSQKNQRKAFSLGTVRCEGKKDAKPHGPSLFQVLKQQAAELASVGLPLDIDGKSSSSSISSKSDDLSVFLAVRPTRSSRSSHGQ